MTSGTAVHQAAFAPPGAGRGGVRYLTPTVMVALVAGVLMVGGLVGPAWAKDGRSRTGDDPLAVSLLYRAMSAPDRVSYTGTQYVSAWSALDRSVSTSAVVDVSHVTGGETVVTGRDAARTVLPAGHDGGSWLGGSGGPIGLLVRTYDVRLVGTGQVAGRPVNIVAAHRPDGSAAAQLWLDAEHALPLRREVYDEHGRTVSASAFVDVQMVANPLPRFVANSANAAAGGASTVSIGLSHDDLASLREHGWLCPAKLDGGLVLYEAHRHAGAVQLSYSDGVTTLSVFEQAGRLDPDTLHGFAEHKLRGGVVYAAPGPPSQFVWSTEDDRMITVVADGSLSGVDAVAAAFPPDVARAPDSLIDRIARGAKRLVSWLNPFD